MDITGTVARVEQRSTFPGSNSVFAKIYFAESPEVFVYVIPTFTPKIAALRGNLTGQKISVHLDRLYPTTSGPIKLSIERPEDLSIGDPRASSPQSGASAGLDPAPRIVQPNATTNTTPASTRGTAAASPARPVASRPTGDISNVREAIVRRRTPWLISDVLGIDSGDIKPGTRLIQDLGADEGDLVELVIKFEDSFKIDISSEEKEFFYCKPAVAGKRACLLTVDQVENFLIKKWAAKDKTDPKNGR